MKKIVVLILAIVLLTSGCGKKNDEKSTQIKTDSVSTDVLPLPADARLADAMDANRDTVGWLTVPGTTIDESVQQSTDNDYYLRRDEKGNYDFEGCYFTDYECVVNDMASLGPNTIIYGHTFQDDESQSHFGQLWKFAKDAEFAKEHKTIYYSTPDGMLEWEIISVGEVDAEKDTSVINALPSKGEMNTLVDMAIERSIYSYDFQPDGVENILTLSTCTGDNATRLVIVARLVTTI